MIRYSRWSPLVAVDEVEAHVRAHVSSVANEDDNPDTNAADVVIEKQNHRGGVLVIGSLDAEPSAPYLRPDFDPEEDVRRNPLSISYRQGLEAL